MSAGTRILFLTSSAPRFEGDGTAPFILNMAQDLCDLGWQVDILAPHAAGLRKQDIIGKVRIYRFGYFYPASCQSLCYNGGVNANLRRSKLNALLIPFFIISQFFAAASLIRKNKYALLHSHWLIPQGAIGMVLSIMFSVPHIVYAHGGDIFGFKGPFFSALKRLIIKKSDVAMTNSLYSVNVLNELVCDKKVIYVIPTGATPVAVSKRRAERHISQQSAVRLQLIFVGRLTEEKGLIYLLKSLIYIKNSADFHLTVIGDGPERIPCEAFIKDHNLQSCVDFKGMCSQDEVFSLLTTADVFIGPSITTRSWTESQGNTFVEAMFCGIPVIASDVGGISDAVIHERTGLLVSEKSPEEIANAVLRLRDDSELRDYLIENALSHAQENFSRYATARKIDALYRECIAD